MKKLFIGKNFFLVSLLTTTLILGPSGCDDDDDETSSTTTTTLQSGKVCTGSTSGTYYSYAGGVIEAAKETLNLELENLSTVGSLENAKSLVSGDCEMAIVQADLFLQSPGLAFQTQSDFKLFSANKGSVAALYPEIIHILVNRDSGITSVADLAGKKVNVGENDSGTFVTAYKVLNVYNQLASQPEYVYEAPSTAVAKVVEGSLDATFYVAGAPISTLENLPADANVTLIPATSTIFNVEYTTEDIPATTYPWLYDDILNNLAVWSLLNVGPSIDRTKLGSFLDTLYANKDSYADKYHAKWALFNKASSVTNIKFLPSAGWNRELIHYFAGVEMPTTEPQLYFCSASTTGTYTKVVQDLIPVVESSLGISLTEKNTSGSLDNMQKMYTGECAMALIQRDIAGYVLSIDQANPTTISSEVLSSYYERVINTLYFEQAHLVVNTGSGIESSRDLVGKKFNLGESGSGTFVSANAMLLFNNINIQAVTPFYEAPSVALPKVISGEYDAMLVIGRAPVSYLAQADCPTDTTVSGCVTGDPTTLPIKLVPIQAPEFLTKTTLSADNYPWQDEDLLDSPQVMALLIVSPGLSIDDTRIPNLMQGMYDLKTSDTVQSPTWNETTFDQTVNSFNLEPMMFDWIVAQYIVNRNNQ